MLKATIMKVVGKSRVDSQLMFDKETSTLDDPKLTMMEQKF